MARNNGANITNLGSVAQAFSRLQQQLYQPKQQQAATRIGIPVDAWPSPLEPVLPIGPRGSNALNLRLQMGQNLVFTPRADVQYTATELKNWSLYPLARICIENVKDLICDLPWQIQPKPVIGESRADKAKRAEGDQNIVTLTEFFSYPDGENAWPQWLRPLIDDLLTIDAPSILVGRSSSGKGGKVGELRVIPGDNIVRYIDENGLTPKAPAPAYAQLWEGIPRINLTTDQLIYRPRNIVYRPEKFASYLYGYSPTEQCIDWIKTGAARLAFVLAYYTDGSIPGVVHVVPPGISTDKVLEAMNWMNSELAGQLAKRQQWRMIQGFKETGDDQIVFTKEALLADAFDDLHIRQICFCYGTSPQRLLRMLNRATSESNQEAADEEGTKPIQTWLTGIVNHIIQRVMGFPGYEMAFSLDREADEAARATADASDVDKGIRTRNEVRKARGEDPRPEANADKLCITGASGLIPIDTEPPAPVAPGAPGTESEGEPGGKGKAKGKEGELKPGEKQPPNGKKPAEAKPGEKLNGKPQPGGKGNGGTGEKKGGNGGKSSAKKAYEDAIALFDDVIDELDKGWAQQPRVPAGSPEGGEWTGGQAQHFRAYNRERRSSWGQGGSYAGSGVSAKAKRALKAYNPAGKEKQAIADRMEERVAKALGLVRSGDNNAFDLHDKSGKVGIELKTMIDSKNGKITMHKDAIERKNAAARSGKVKTILTIVADKRQGKTQYYVAHGVGSFRVNNMDATTLPKLSRLLEGAAQYYGGKKL